MIIREENADKLSCLTKRRLGRLHGIRQHFCGLSKPERTHEGILILNHKICCSIESHVQIGFVSLDVPLIKILAKYKQWTP